MTKFDLASTDLLLSTTRAVRKRLDLGRPIDSSLIVDCIRLSQQAPTGSNRQGWRWIVITDVEKRKIIADYYRTSAGNYLEDAKNAAINRNAVQDTKVFESAQYLADNMDAVPVQIIPCIDTSHIPFDAPGHKWLALGGSIFPAIWSFQLALRARGLGSCITTLHLAYENEISDLIGVPTSFSQVALLPVAYTKGTDFKPAKRPPVDEIVHWNKWE
ncbi:MAG: nitroreductase [Rhodospirillaceae bacterium]|nr:nitroreductase [Rhodospirillaceae bacterium]|tara:strand:+ start:517 stop:1164 length:648 start_codon:yes stop_codon:yes gene_type:complete